jgi:lipopolysaccharide export system protein LptC
MPNAAIEIRRGDFERWRRRSRLIHRLRIAFPMAIVLIMGGLAGAIIENAIRGKPLQAEEEATPIRLVNPRFVGRDDKRRLFTLTAATAVRDQRDYQRVILDKPALVLDEGGPASLRVTAAAGVYNERTRKLDMTGGVKISGSQGAFETAASLFDTKTGELIGSGPIHGAGSLGEIDAKSYGVYDKGDRIVFKGRVRARIDN